MELEQENSVKKAGERLANKQLQKVLIKRYPNRKLYDTSESKYIVLDDVRALVKIGLDIQVIDNKTKKDLTALTLLQVFFEDQKKKLSDQHMNAPRVEDLVEAVRAM